jgi:hypothetical protein
MTALNGAAVVDEVAATLRHFVVMGSAQADAAALWVAHTYVFDRFDYSPYLAVSSPVKRCGKTTTMKVLRGLAARPWSIITPSEAVLYRKIARDTPTVFLDEFDAVFSGKKDYEPVRAVFNAGNEAGTVVPRCGGKNRDELQEFPIFSPKALAGIGRLPETISDRSIIVELKRKRKSDDVQPFRRREARLVLQPLREQLERWAASVDGFGDYPDPLDQLSDRANDSWEALLMVADHLGGEWPQRARAAALELSAQVAQDDDSISILLLADVRDCFAELNDPERIASADLSTMLALIEGSPWGEWGRSGKEITPTALARLLKPYQVRPKLERIEGRVQRGYERAEFEDTWERYLTPDAPNPDPNRYTRYNGPTKPLADDSQTVTDGAALRSENGASPLNQADVTPITLQKGEMG